MTTQYWINGTSGDWSDGCDWQSGQVPTSADDAVISDSSAVSVNGTAVANSLSLDSSDLTVAGSLSVVTSIVLAGSSELSLNGGSISAQSIDSSGGGIIGHGVVDSTLSGSFSISPSGGTLELGGQTTGSYTSVAFSPQNGPAMIKLDHAAEFNDSQFLDVTAGDIIDLVGIDDITSADFNGVTLFITESNGQQFNYFFENTAIVGDTLTVIASTDGTEIYWSQPPEGWIFGTSGNWSDASDWQSGRVPTSADNVVISDALAVTFNGTTPVHGVSVNGTAAANSLSLDDSDLTVAGSLSVATSIVLAGGSELYLNGGSISAQSIDISGGHLFEGVIHGHGVVGATLTGTYYIYPSGGTLELGGQTLGSTTNIVFTAQNGPTTVKLDQPAEFAGTFQGITASDTIDLVGIDASSAVFNGTTLTITETNGQQLNYIDYYAGVAGDTLTVAPSTDGTEIYWSQPPESWITGTSGDWSDASDWQSGRVPTSADDAVISDTSGVSINGTAVANSLSLDSSDLMVAGSLSVATSLVFAGSSELSLNGGSISAPSIDTFGLSGGTINGHGIVDATLSGVFSIYPSGGTLELGDQTTGSYTDIFFSAQNGPATIKLDQPAEFSVFNAIDGITAGDTIDLVGIDTSSAVFNGGTLTITENSGQQLSYTFLNTAVAGDTLVVTASSDGTEIYWSTPCYCRGTRILTPRGPLPVENLKIGDMVKTLSGVSRPIKWIGRRSYSGRFVVGRRDVLPVCIKAGALADDIPERDLWISPHHAMYLDEALIEAKDLINGVSIVQANHVDRIEYFHIELETHDVIFAEGAPSETFIDDDSRGMFHNAAEHAALYPEIAAPRAVYCAPRLEDGYEVEAIRQRIASRAGLNCGVPATGAGMLRGYVELISKRAIGGWAQNLDHPDTPVCLDIFAGGRLIGQVLANNYREDLKRAGMGSGRYGFTFAPAQGVLLDHIEVRRSFDGATLQILAAAVCPRSRSCIYSVWRRDDRRFVHAI